MRRGKPSAAHNAAGRSECGAASQEVEGAQQPQPGCSRGRVEVAELDLNSLASVRRWADCSSCPQSQGAGVVLQSFESTTRRQPLIGMHFASSVQRDSRQARPAETGSVARFIARLAARRLALSLLVCNAGIMGGPRQTTVDGLEMQFQVGCWRRSS